MAAKRVYLIDDAFGIHDGPRQAADFQREFLPRKDVKLEAYLFDLAQPLAPQLEAAVQRALAGGFDVVILDVYFGAVGERPARLGIDWALPRLADAGMPVIVISSLADTEKTLANIYDTMGAGVRYLAADRLGLLADYVAQATSGADERATVDHGFRYRHEEELAARKRIESVFDAVARSVGSKPIELPLCAPVSNFLGRAPLPVSERDSDRLFKGITTDGKPIAVRYEGTALTAKWVAHEIRSNSEFRSARYHYVQEMVRVEQRADLDMKHYRSFYQAGFECFALGEESRASNASAVVELLFRMFDQLGMDLTLRFSHVRLLPACLDPLQLQPFQRRRIIGALEKERTLEGVDRILDACDVPKEAMQMLRKLATRRRTPLTDAADFLKSASPDFLNVAEDLERLAASLSALGIDSRSLFDPGIHRSLDFYDGVTMQGDLPMMEECLGGGDFTGLVEHFGVPGPVYSFGMAVGVERLMHAMSGPRQL